MNLTISGTAQSLHYTETLAGSRPVRSLSTMLPMIVPSSCIICSFFLLTDCSVPMCKTQELDGDHSPCKLLRNRKCNTPYDYERAVSASSASLHMYVVVWNWDSTMYTSDLQCKTLFCSIYQDSYFYLINRNSLRVTWVCITTEG